MIVAARLVMAAARLRRAPAMGTRLSHCCIGGLPGVVVGPAPAPGGRIPVQRPGMSSGHSAGGTRRRRAQTLPLTCNDMKCTVGSYAKHRSHTVDRRRTGEG